MAATLTSAVGLVRTKPQYGVRVTAALPDPTVQVELQRAADVGGVPGVGATVGYVSLTAPVFVDPLPNNGTQVWYRGRCVDGVRTPSAWTTWQSVIPYELGATTGPGMMLSPVVQSLGAGATVAGAPAEDVARQQHGVFFETFEQDASTGLWDWRTGTPTLALVSGVGQAGGRVLQAQNYGWLVYKNNIAFDPSKLYRLRVRVRMTVAPTNPALDNVYLGLEGYAADGTTIVDTAGGTNYALAHWVAAAAFDMGSVGTGTWVEFTGYVKGTAGAGATTPSVNASAPAALQTNVRYVRPVMVLNSNGGNGTMQVDEFAMDVANEETAKRTWTGLDTNGDLARDIVQTRAVAGASRTLVRAHSAAALVPNGDFEVWDTANPTGQPLGWKTYTLPGSYLAYKDTTNVYSGDASLQVGVFAAFGAFSGAVNTYDNKLGSAFCIPVRAGRVYRVQVAARGDTAGMKYEVQLDTNSAGIGTTYQKKQFTIAAANTWQVDSWTVTVPVGASPNAALSFNLPDTFARNWWVDSVRMVEDPDDYTQVAGRLSQSGGDIVLNGDFEAGFGFWRIAPLAGGGGYWGVASQVTKETASPWRGATSLKMAYDGSHTNVRVWQTDSQADDLNVTGNPVKVKVTPGDIYIVRAVMKCSGSGGCGASVGVREFGSDGTTTLNETSVVSASVSTAGSYTLFETSFRVSSSTEFVVPVLYASFTTAGDAVWFDEVHIFKALRRQHCKATSTVAASVANNSATVLSAATTEYDNYGGWGGASHPSRITAGGKNLAPRVVGGLFMVVAEVDFASAGSGIRQVRLKVTRPTTGSSITEIGKAIVAPGNLGTECRVQCVGYDDNPTNDDYYEVEVLQTSGGSLNCTLNRFAVSQMG